MFGKKDQDLLAEAYRIVIEGKQNEEEFHPGGGMVPAPIGSDTVTGKGLKKLWGIKMRAGKWADTFVGQYDLRDGKNFGIIDVEGVTRYASVDDFKAAFKKLRREASNSGKTYGDRINDALSRVGFNREEFDQLPPEEQQEVIRVIGNLNLSGKQVYRSYKRNRQS